MTTDASVRASVRSVRCERPIRSDNRETRLAPLLESAGKGPHIAEPPRAQQAGGNRRACAALTLRHNARVLRKMARRFGQVSQENVPRAGNVSFLPLRVTSHIDQLNAIATRDCFGELVDANRRRRRDCAPRCPPGVAQLAASPGHHAIETDQGQRSTRAFHLVASVGQERDVCVIRQQRARPVCERPAKWNVE